MALDLRYVAGLFDGEGYVRSDDYLPKDRIYPRYQIVAGIAMTYKPVIQMLHEQFGGTSYGDDCFQKKYAKNRIIYRWYVDSKIAYSFLKAIEPFATVKREQILLALELQEHVWTHLAAIKGRAADSDFKKEIFAYRAELSKRISELKKVDYPLVDNDPVATPQAA